MTMQRSLVIWGGGTTRTFRPIWVAEELGLPYEHKAIGPRTGETQTIEYTALNPRQKIPYMKDGDFGMSESVAICRYLIGVYGNDDLHAPKGDKARAKEDEWVSYIYGELDETSLYVMRRHRDLHEIYGEAPAAVTAAHVYAQRHLEIVGEQLAGREFVHAEHFGLADILLVSCLDWAGFYQIEIPDVLLTYKARLSQRPAYQAAFAKNYAQLAKSLSGGASQVAQANTNE